MSMTKGQRRYTKREMGFEESPPHCGNCVHFKPKQHRQQTAANGEKFLVILQATCTAGDFITNHSSCCDHWISFQGDTLQREKK
jgi:hypothetical protein